MSQAKQLKLIKTDWEVFLCYGRCGRTMADMDWVARDIYIILLTTDESKHT